MRRYLNISLKIIGGLLGIVLLIWLGISLYVKANHEVLLKNITEQLNDNISGKLSIESMEPELIRGFPGISVSLKNVLLRDSLWENHKHNLLEANKVYVAVDALSLLTGPPRIKKISVEGGAIYFYSDSLGYSNTSLFSKRTAGNNNPGEAKKNSKINNIHFSDISFIYDNKFKNKFFNIDVSSFSGALKNNSKGWKAVVDLKSMVNQLEFNTRRGSFLKNRHLRMNDLNLVFDNDQKKLTIPSQLINIEDDAIRIGGFFMFAENSSDFSLNIQAKNIPFRNASALLLPHITKKLKSYDLKKPIDVQALIKGQLKGAGKQPLVRAAWQVKNNTLTAAGEIIKNCSFTGTFTNQLIAGNGRTDTNSVIIFYGMLGKWYNIDFRAPKIMISNLKRPIIEGKFTSNFHLKKLNAVSGGKTFHFNGGTAVLDLLYKAPFYKTDNKPNFIVGTIRINNAAATYQPRNLKFNRISLLLNFKGQDLFLQNMKVRSGKTQLYMNASLRNFLNLYYTDPKKIVLDWQITSPEINLGEFIAFLGKRKSGVKVAKTDTESKAASSRIFQQLDEVLDQANAHMLLKVDRLVYKNFVASNITSDITMKQSGIAINRVSLNHGGGRLEVNGNIDQSGSLNKITTATRITNVDVQKLFASFDNFGQDAITDQNLRGVFFGSTNMSATMRDNGEIVPRSFYGTVSFDIRNGALVKFEPMEKIGKLTFPNRNFSNITFKNLKNTLTIEGNKVLIPPMHIETSVFNIFANGVYSFTTGTNIALEVPLRNPQKDALLSDSLRETRIRRGIVLNLTAVDGLNGNVKIKLGKKKVED